MDTGGAATNVRFADSGATGSALSDKVIAADSARGELLPVHLDHTSSETSHDFDSQGGNALKPFSPARLLDGYRHWHCGQ